MKRRSWISVCLISFCLTNLPASKVVAHAAWMTPAAQIQLGNDSLQRHQWSDAVHYFRMAVAMDYHSSDAHCGLAYAYLHRGDIERARWQFEEDLRLHPHCPAAEKGLQLTFKNESDRVAYMAQLQDEVKSDPKNADAVASVAEELFDRGDIDSATTEANQALAISPSLGHAHCVLGHIALAKGDTSTATTELLAAIRGDKNDDDAWAALGDIAMGAQDYKAAIDDYRHAVAAFPQHREWHVRLANAYDRNGDPRSAERERSLIPGLMEPLPETTASQ